MKRLFLAFDLSEDVRRSLAGALFWMAGFAGRVKVVPPENYHVTLKFLGPTPEQRLASIRDALEQEACFMAPCELGLAGWGVFPEKGTAKVFWVGVEPAEALRPVFERCESILEKQGFAREMRGFQSHVTVAREGSSPVPADFLERWRSLRPVQGPVTFRADKVALYESRTNAAGPVYTPVALIGLGM